MTENLGAPLSTRPGTGAAQWEIAEGDPPSQTRPANVLFLAKNFFRN
jgi:hypothetical protein